MQVNHANAAREKAIRISNLQTCLYIHQYLLRQNPADKHALAQVLLYTELLAELEPIPLRPRKPQASRTKHQGNSKPQSPK